MIEKWERKIRLPLTSFLSLLSFPFCVRFHCVQSKNRKVKNAWHHLWWIWLRMCVCSCKTTEDEKKFFFTFFGFTFHNFLLYCLCSALLCFGGNILLQYDIIINVEEVREENEWKKCWKSKPRKENETFFSDCYEREFMTGIEMCAFFKYISPVWKICFSFVGFHITQFA